MCGLTIFISICVPINKAICVFYVITVILTILTILWVTGLITYLNTTGFYPAQRVYLEKHKKWMELPAEEYPPTLSTLNVAGSIMLMIYILPFIMRPLDFLRNPKSYLVGLASYFSISPVFIVIM